MKRSLTRLPAALAQLKFKPLPKPGRSPACGAQNLEDLRQVASWSAAIAE